MCTITFIGLVVPNRNMSCRIVWFVQAPRRQCCQVINGRKGTVDVHIRDCNKFESVTPLQ